MSPELRHTLAMLLSFLICVAPLALMYYAGTRVVEVVDDVPDLFDEGGHPLHPDLVALNEKARETP